MKNVRLRTGRIKSKPEHSLQSCQESVRMRAQLCLALCSEKSHAVKSHGLFSPPGSPVHGISQARLLGWVAISFFRGSS